jgi:plastocyanin
MIIICGLMFAGTTRAQSSGAKNGEAGTGSISGKISISGEDAISEDLMRERSMIRYHSAASDEQKDSKPYSLGEKAVVYIESVKGETARHRDQSSEHPQLVQSEMLFRPLVLPIVVGSTVDFPNEDKLFHNVFSYSEPKEFDLGKYPKGQSRSVMFDKPGVVSVFCEIHSYMYATILVLQNPFFAVPADDGGYTIDGIPPGSYKLTFWYGRKKVESRAVTITSGETATENFSE